MGKARRLLALTILAAASFQAAAQSSAPSSAPPALIANCGTVAFCTTNVAIAQTGNTPGATLTAMVAFGSAAAVTNYTLDVEFHDPSGNKVGQTWQTGVSFTAGQIVTVPALSYTVPAGAALGTYTVNVGVFNASNTQLFWQNSAATFPIVAPFAAPCYPSPVAVPLQAAFGAIPTSVGSTVNDSYAAWTCNTGTGYVSVVSLYKLADIAPYVVQWVASLVTPSALNAVCATMCAPYSPAEQAFAQTLHAKYDATATVNANGATKTRVVYAQTNGTVGAQVGNSRVRTGAPCLAWDRIPGTSFYSVNGQPDPVNGGTLGEVYAQCTVKLPTGSN